MTVKDAVPLVLLDNVVGLINSKVSTAQAKLVKQFASGLYSNASRDDLLERNDNDLYGAALSLWNELNKTAKGKRHIRVLNPTQSQHGWQSTRSIIEVIHPDMPFLIDSVCMTLNRLGITAHMVLHKPFLVERKKGLVSKIASPMLDNKDNEHVAVFCIEIDRQSDNADIEELETEIGEVLTEVAAAVKDWQPMSQRLKGIIEELKKQLNASQIKGVKEAIDFLTYLNNHHFTLLGYRRYQIKKIKGDIESIADAKTGLGLLSESCSSGSELSTLLSSIPPNAREQVLNDNLLILRKSQRKSRVHRPANIDFIGIKHFDATGNVIGEDRFLGLYASNLYNRSPREIPLLQGKVNRVLELSGLTPKSHGYKALINVIENLPRDELIQASVDELANIGNGVLQMQDRDKLKLFVRKDAFGHYFSCLVYVAKERYNTKLRQDAQSILARHFNTDEPVEFTTYFSESRLARTHYIVTVKDNNMDFDIAAIENDLFESARSWEDKLNRCLSSTVGDDIGDRLCKKYFNGFSPSYKEDVIPSAAVVDLQHLEALNDKHTLGMLFYRPQENAICDDKVRLKLFHKDEPIHLSDMLPMLENFGLRVINERPYELMTINGEVFWILDFLMTLKSVNSSNLEDSQSRFQTALAAVWNKELEDDGFNRILLTSSLHGREVSILRAYAKYMRQIDATFSQSYIEETFSRYPVIADLLVKMFIRKFKPKFKTRTLTKLLSQVEQLLDDVSSLDDDRIIRRYLDLMNATLRTNFYQLSTDGNPKPYISFKFSPDLIPDMPKPLPKYEIFVYSPRVEGVHLRGGKVARGGLRWSDRREDFRTEVLGLVKAQQVKNTVIVPVGAKGGFVCKQMPADCDREIISAEGQACYKLFIRGLLDITDNIVNGENISPRDVVCHDENDPYLVVAADKGTATFSDIANEIAIEYNFWLGDAFASGGSNGYDHKKMGITAKGAWESVKRHFRELGHDCQSAEFSCVAIGDMAGDVFGNGMLLSKQTKLIAAFNHLHIFIDPNPDIAASYKERSRLFALPRSGWNDYNQKLISNGGGIFSRSAKSITLTNEIKTMLDVKVSTMTPTALIKELLRMEVDLIWNGGIGTYIKASSESHVEVGDRANDALRVNGSDVQARIVGEGGNLGCTQLGRIEYAANGGRINTDFIDNVGGVDCSDNEVNIKILLNALVDDGEMTIKQRNRLLVEMTDEVSDIVLNDCNDQTSTISVTQFSGVDQLKEQIRFIHYLEKEGKLDRALEFLPSEDELAERMTNGCGLTRPELSVLVAYAKMLLKEQLLTKAVTEDSYLSQLLIAYFPQKLQKKYINQMIKHPLRGEIIATSLANELVNDMGLNFVKRMQDETGATVAEVAICYAIAREVFGLKELTIAISSLNICVAANVQAEMLHQLRRIMRRVSRWFLRHRDPSRTIEQTIAFYKPVVEDLKVNLSHYVIDAEMAVLNVEVCNLIDQGVTDDVARFIAYLSTLFSSMDIAQIASIEEKPVALVAETFFKLGAHIELHLFLDQINAQPVSNHWQALARSAYREELDWQQRALTSVVLNTCADKPKAKELIPRWVNDNKDILERWFNTMADFKTNQNNEFAKFSVALRELNLLILHCERKK